MAIYCKIVDGNVVNSIVVPDEALLDENGDSSDLIGEEYCKQFGDFLWLRTYEDGSQRKNFAGILYTYDAEHDAFIPPKPDRLGETDAREWVLNMDTFRWDLVEG